MGEYDHWETTNGSKKFQGYLDSGKRVVCPIGVAGLLFVGGTSFRYGARSASIVPSSANASKDVVERERLNGPKSK
jgi:hypothetical protein